MNMDRAKKLSVIVAAIAYVGGIGTVVAVRGHSGVIEPGERPAQVVSCTARTIMHQGNQVGAILDVELDRLGLAAFKAGEFWSESGAVADRFQWVILAPDGKTGLQEAVPEWLSVVQIRTSMLTGAESEITEWTFEQGDR